MEIIKNNYLNTITSEHRLKDKYIKTLETFLNPLEEYVLCLGSYEFNFNADDAIGNQLDILGEIVGVKRALDFKPADGSSNILSDEDYRFLIKSKVAQNSWDGTLEGLNNIWKNMFPETTLVIYDNQDMSATLLLVEAMTPIQLQMLLEGKLLPKPVGVRYTYSLLTKLLFAYNQESGNFAGYNVGYWNGDFKLFSIDMDGGMFLGFDEGEWV